MDRQFRYRVTYYHLNGDPDKEFVFNVEGNDLEFAKQASRPSYIEELQAMYAQMGLRITSFTFFEQVAVEHRAFDKPGPAWAPKLVVQQAHAAAA